MKLRIKGNSIRLRLTQSEVDTLAIAGFVRESVSFGEETFGYEIRSDVDGDAVTADLVGTTIVVWVPAGRVQDWAASDSVSIEQEGIPYLLIEKDFACLSDRPGEDDSDAFPNPRQKC
jgi:hypothetical protein